jgi:hypothetical protein
MLFLEKTSSCFLATYSLVNAWLNETEFLSVNTISTGFANAVLHNKVNGIKSLRMNSPNNNNQTLLFVIIL